MKKWLSSFLSQSPVEVLLCSAKQVVGSLKVPHSLESTLWCQEHTGVMSPREGS